MVSQPDPDKRDLPPSYFEVIGSSVLPPPYSEFGYDVKHSQSVALPPTVSSGSQGQCPNIEVSMPCLDTSDSETSSCSPNRTTSLLSILIQLIVVLFAIIFLILIVLHFLRTYDMAHPDSNASRGVERSRIWHLEKLESPY
ncbi:unnamed protein product [Allacma fusca]|uniref:Uncharacterized protein n=1 Tax=Allacma fusca TaxID=39272 RepID=A0A8J2PIA9_9HEXA|nr:unnamed protein product [Allacma fusca]